MRISDWRSDVCSSDLLAGARLEIAPEAFEHRLPLRATARHVVEFLLQPRGEIIADIAFEEAFEEGGEQAPAFFGDEAVFLDRHIGAILGHLQYRGIGRSEERRVGKDGVRRCRLRWSP